MKVIYIEDNVFVKKTKSHTAVYCYVLIFLWWLSGKMEKKNRSSMMVDR